MSPSPVCWEAIVLLLKSVCFTFLIALLGPQQARRLHASCIACIPAASTLGPLTAKPTVRQVAAKLGQQVFRDRLQWDAAAPLGSEARYAARVAADLGLGWSWQRAIAAALLQQLQARLHLNNGSIGLLRRP